MICRCIQEKNDVLEHGADALPHVAPVWNVTTFTWIFVFFCVSLLCRRSFWWALKRGCMRWMLSRTPWLTFLAWGQSFRSTSSKSRRNCWWLLVRGPAVVFSVENKCLLSSRSRLEIFIRSDIHSVGRKSKGQYLLPLQITGIIDEVQLLSII